MALAVLGLLLVGPVFMALSTAKEMPARALCMSDMGCDGFSKSFPAGG